MRQDRIKIFNFRDGILLTVISYTVYSAIWFLIDNEWLRDEEGLLDFVTDFVFCVIYSVISVTSCHFIFSSFGFRNYLRRSFIYSPILILTNSIIAIVMNVAYNLTFDNTDNLRFEVQEIYTYALFVTVVSGTYIYCNTLYE